MAVIGLALFVQVADRLAKQARILETATLDAQVTGGGKFYPRIHGSLPDAGDIDVEDDLIKKASDLDNDILANDLFNTIYGNFITAIDRHVKRKSFANVDAYLVGTGTSGINVDDGFAKAYKGTTGSELDARNVFGPETNIAFINFTSSGVASLTKENATGSGGTTDHTDTASSGFATGNHAAANMRLFVGSGLGTPSVATLELVMKFENTNIAVSGVTVTFSGTETTTVGTTKNVGTHPNNAFIDISSTQVAGGASGLILQLKSIKEREVAL